MNSDSDFRGSIPVLKNILPYLRTPKACGHFKDIEDILF